MTPRMMCIALALFLAGPAFADDAAEYERMSKQMESLAQRNAWAGVEREYMSIEGLELELKTKELLLGAQAARNRGDAFHCRERLMAAMTKATEGGEAFSPELAQWLGELQTNYGRVHLIAKNGAARLGSKQSFFQPDRRTAAQYAAEELMNTGEFNGLLPVGVYIWGGEVIDVTAGAGEPEKRKLKRVKPKRQYW